VSSIPKPLARRIDRLARRAHAFHRFAHHPLCAAYRGEILQIGQRTRVCRGCLLSWAGAGAGAAAGFLIRLPSPRALGAALALAAILAAAWMVARARGLGRKTSKWLSRFAPFACAGALAAAGVRSGTALGACAAVATAALVALGLRTYRRLGPDRGPCLACPESGKARACSGLRHAVRAELAFQRLAGRWLQASLAGSPGGEPER
jgi:hypothetical protein